MKNSGGLLTELINDFAVSCRLLGTVFTLIIIGLYPIAWIVLNLILLNFYVFEDIEMQRAITSNPIYLFYWIVLSMAALLFLKASTNTGRQLNRIT